ncbi:L-lysine 2,3-aminomutase [Seiridium cupressi]
MYLSTPSRLPACRQYSAVPKLFSLRQGSPKQFSDYGPATRARPRLSRHTGTKRHLSTSSVKPASAVSLPRLPLDDLSIPPLPAQKEPAQDEFWRKIPMWKDVSTDQFMSWFWSNRNAVEFHKRSDPIEFRSLMTQLLPDSVPLDRDTGERQSRDEFIDDIFAGFACSTMSALRLQSDQLGGPSARPHFPPIRAIGVLNAPGPSNVQPGFATRERRFQSRGVGAPISRQGIIPRSYEVGADTVQHQKSGKFKQNRARWNRCLQYIEDTPEIRDVVVSGGDSFYLGSHHLIEIGLRLINMPNIKKIRFASKGLAISPTRFLDPKDDWTDALIYVSKEAEKAGKRVALHTHFNHPNEISWVTKQASKRLRDAGVTVRNQSVLLRGINDDVKTMGTLIRTLSDTLRIQPYYVYQCDMVEKAEHFRTPLQTILDMEKQLRGSIAGFDMPTFVVDLPGGGGKRLAQSYNSYDRSTGISTFEAPAVKGGNKIYKYYDPADSLVKNE